MQVLTLSGNWRVEQTGRGSKTLRGSIPGTVPGCIHTDLLAAGAIEDPYYRDNEKRLQWIGWADWEYSRSFDVPAQMLQHDLVLLRCHGLDTIATIRLNGRLLAQADNMFRTWEFDVKPLLRPGPNEIAVQFASPLTWICRNHPEMKKQIESWTGFTIPGGQFVRKEPCNFGWDWGAKLVTCGIWREIELVGFSGARLADVRVLQKHASGTVTLAVEAVAEVVRRGVYVADVELSYKGRAVARTAVRMRGGRGTAEIVVPNPKLWWPAGMGSQPLYNLTVTLRDEQRRLLDSQARRIGLRQIDLVRRKDKHGESFYFTANERPFFAKGANWIPADTFQNRVTPQLYRHLLGSAVAANMNMIRVWGGGVYEDDAFYDICDELGLVVWQDFMFANARYPLSDPAFRESTGAEIADNVRRVRHHASIALWCGNNELELVVRWWPDAAAYWPEHWDYFAMKKGFLAKLLGKLDPQCPYWPGSPHGGEYNDPDRGDAHTWEVWHGRKPFEWYRTAFHRFCSEFGFQSFPEPRTVESYTLPADRNITSPVMEHHQRNNDGNGLILHYMLSWFRVPKDFASMLWASQILQALAIQYAVEHWRRNVPRCMGAIYWQLNDCWPVASWSSIDSLGRWKALHYAARRFFAPIMLSAVEDTTRKTIDLYVCSDEAELRSGELSWIVTDLRGRSVLTGRKRVRITPGKGRGAARVDLAGAARQHGAENLLLFAELTAGGKTVSRTHAAFVKPKQMELEDPDISARVTAGDDGEFIVRLAAKRPALWVWLELAGIDARWEDNFFHLCPGEPVTITARPAKAVGLAEFKQALRVRSLADLH